MNGSAAPSGPLSPGCREIETWLVAHLAELLAVDPAEVDAAKPLYSYGLSSREEVTFAGDLEEWLGRELPATLVWDHPSIAEISRFLSGEEDAVEASA